MRRCRFLNDEYFAQLYDAFLEAFSDYVIPFALTETQFRNHIRLNAVDLERSVGCEDRGRLVAFSLTGFGSWNGRSTAYDAGTGVVPSHRRHGLSREMFDMMVPWFREDGVEQFLLEVVTSNTAAISLYQNLGFQPVRRLALLQRDGRLVPAALTPTHGAEIRGITEPDWDKLTVFWDCQPSWQNSIDAVERSLGNKSILGAFVGGECVGYIIFSSQFGRVSQLAVAHDRRGLGIGTALVLAMQDAMADGFSMQVINIDKASTGAMKFFDKLGFSETLSQHEMIKPM